ncbi:MAG: TAXI family TRAP transporter solute-binding subunit [Aquisalimonadaceae bacterium]
MKYTKPLVIGLAAGVALAVSGAAVSQEQRVRVLTAPTGTIVHTTGSAIASVVSQKTDLTVLATPMAGPQVFIPQINNGQGEFTLLNAADSFEALRGGTGYNAPQKNLRLAAVGFTNELGMLVRRDSDIRTAEDVKGRRVTGVFSAHKTCEQLSNAQLGNLGLTWDDVNVIPVTHSRTAVQALAEGRADVAMCVPLGQPVVQELNAQTPIRFLSMVDSADAVERARAAFPAGQIRHYEAGANVGVVDAVNVWSYPFYLLAHEGVSDDLVYKVVSAVSSNVEDLRGISGVFKRWIPENMIDADITLPVHGGAKRFYEEQGMWNADIQKAHEKNLRDAQ